MRDPFIYLIHCSNNETDISSNILDLIQEREPFNINYPKPNNRGIIVNHQHKSSTLHAHTQNILISKREEDVISRISP